jgi:hypothetical protein
LQRKRIFQKVKCHYAECYRRNFSPCCTGAEEGQNQVSSDAVDVQETGERASEGINVFAVVGPLIALLACAAACAAAAVVRKKRRLLREQNDSKHGGKPRVRVLHMPISPQKKKHCATNEFLHFPHFFTHYLPLVRC